MALSTLTAAALAVTYGVASAETGLNVTGFDFTTAPEFIEKIKNYQNQTVGRIEPTIPSGKITITAETLTAAASGMMTATFLTDCASLIANEKTGFGALVSAGLIMLDSVEENQSRTGIRTIKFMLTKDPLMTAVS